MSQLEKNGLVCIRVDRRFMKRLLNLTCEQSSTTQGQAPYRRLWVRAANLGCGAAGKSRRPRSLRWDPADSTAFFAGQLHAWRGKNEAFQVLRPRGPSLEGLMPTGLMVSQLPWYLCFKFWKTQKRVLSTPLEKRVRDDNIKMLLLKAPFQG